jgi:hypothetical protein
MKAMADPMMVAAKTHGTEARVQGAEAWPERITPSSHGGIPMFATGYSFHASPLTCPADLEKQEAVKLVRTEKH